jgi:pimeloyl-ACP methyl ester carboxylesterase
MCVHGLTRNGRDFDPLAKAFADDFRVICPDVVGRGKSAYLPVKEYEYGVYCADMTALIARLDVESVDWIGTSMGGLIGLVMGARKGSPIRRMVLNDIGPFIPAQALARVTANTGTSGPFPDLDAAAAFLRESLLGYRDLPAPLWAHVMEHSFVRGADGRYALAYDPAIGDALRAGGPAKDADMWGFWDRLRCKVLALQGGASDFLTDATVAEMQTRGPKAKVVSFPGIGHPIPLMKPDEIALVRDWLLEP